MNRKEILNNEWLFCSSSLYTPLFQTSSRFGSSPHLTQNWFTRKKKCCLSNRLSNLDANKLIPYNKKNTSNNKKTPSMIRVSTSVKLWLKGCLKKTNPSKCNGEIRLPPWLKQDSRNCNGDVDRLSVRRTYRKAYRLWRCHLDSH